MAVDADALTTYEAVKAYLGLSDDSDQSLIEDLIDRATDWIESYCDREFAADVEDRTEYRDGQGADWLLVKKPPIISVTSLTVDEDEIDAADVDTPSDSGYRLYETEGMIHCTSSFGDGRKNVKLIYKGGYATIPEDLVMACIKLVAGWYNYAKHGVDGFESEKLGQYSYKLGDLAEQTPGVLSVLRACH